MASSEIILQSSLSATLRLSNPSTVALDAPTPWRQLTLIVKGRDGRRYSLVFRASAFAQIPPSTLKSGRDLSSSPAVARAQFATTQEAVVTGRSSSCEKRNKDSKQWFVPWDVSIASGPLCSLEYVPLSVRVWNRFVCYSDETY